MYFERSVWDFLFSNKTKTKKNENKKIPIPKWQYCFIKTVIIWKTQSIFYFSFVHLKKKDRYITTASTIFSQWSNFFDDVYSALE